MHCFHKFILAWNSTCFGQFLCPSSGVCSLYTQQWYMSYSFVDSFPAETGWSCSKAVYKSVWYIPLLSVEWINYWRWTEELSETCRVYCQNKFVKLVFLVGFIIKKFVVMHGHIVVVLYCSMYCLCVNVYCHRVTTQLQLTNISYHMKHGVVTFPL